MKFWYPETHMKIAGLYAYDKCCMWQVQLHKNFKVRHYFPKWHLERWSFHLENLKWKIFQFVLLPFGAANEIRHKLRNNIWKKQCKKGDEKFQEPERPQSFPSIVIHILYYLRYKNCWKCTGRRKWKKKLEIFTLLH